MSRAPTRRPGLPDKIPDEHVCCLVCLAGHPGGREPAESAALSLWAPSAPTHEDQPKVDEPQRASTDDRDHRGTRAGFSSRLGVVFATAGVAIGLGNIWRFPYMMGRDGGVVFLILYFVIVLLFGAPMLISEWALGRHTRRGPWGVMERIGAPMGRLWSILLLITVVMSSSYYGVVVAWVLQEGAEHFTSALTGDDVRPFSDLTKALPSQGLFLLVTVGIGCGALAMGVRRGIERVSQIILPVFFLLFLVVLVRVLTLDGAVDGLRAFLRPDLSKLRGATALSALGQAIFSLGLGGTFMVLYGSYMREEMDIPRTAIATVGADLAAALLAGLIVVPAVLAFGMDIAGGPELLFVVLPEVFEKMTLGSWIGALFFLAIFIVALLSLIAAYETIVAALQDGLGWSRRRSLLLVLISQVALATPAYLFARYIEISDLVWGTTMQPIGAGLAVIAFAWCMGRGRALAEIRRSSTLPIPGWLFLWIRYVIPVVILLILGYGWVDWLR